MLPGNDPRDDPGARPRCVRGNSCWPRHPPNPAANPGERSRPPLDAAATCHAVTGPITPAVPNRAVTAAIAAPTAASDVPPRRAERFRHRLVHPGQPGHHREMHPDRLQPGAPPPQPAADRARRHAQPHRDPAVTKAGRPRRQRGADHLDGVRPSQQHRDRQQHVRDQAATRTGLAAAAASRPHAPDDAGPSPTEREPPRRPGNRAARPSAVTRPEPDLPLP